MAKIKKRSSMGGVGCLLQGLGVVSVILALVTLPTIVGPLVFGLLGIWLLQNLKIFVKYLFPKLLLLLYCQNYGHN